MNNENFIKAIFLAAISAMSPLSAYPDLLSPEEALRAVLSRENTPRLNVPQTDRNIYKLAYQWESTALSGPMLYIFNNEQEEEGYMIVGADSSLPMLLGYSSEGTFSFEDSSPAMQWWIEEYGQQIEWAQKHRSPSPATYGDENRTPVSPIIKTQWNQSTPYNGQCPQNYPTGCVATAMAQVAKAFEWPPQNGIGTHSYPWTKSTTLSFDYEAATFKWDEMISNYETEPYTESQAEAVATLMYAAGVGVDMAYASGGSGAPAYRIPYALVNHFGYDKGATFRIREYFSDEQWQDMIYEEVKAGRPVLYGGQSQSVGHEFICDGYADDGFFHINWGWAGRCDGYFRLSALNPYEHGIGGSTTGDGYNFNQEIITGICPPMEGSVRYLPIYGGGGFTVFTNNGNYFFGFGTPDNPTQGMWSYSAEDLTTILGFKLTDLEGSSVYHEIGTVEWPGGSSEGISGYYNFSIDFSSFKFKEGRYRVYPTLKEPDGEWQEIAVPYGTSGHIMMDVAADGTLSFSNGIPDNRALLDVTGFEELTAPTSAADGLYKITIANGSDAPYEGTISAIISPDGQTEALDQTVFSAELSPYQEKTIKFRWTPDVAEGDYNVIFMNQYGDTISTPFSYRMQPIKFPALSVVECTPRTQPEESIRTAFDVTIHNDNSVPYYSSVEMRVYSDISPEPAGNVKFYALVSGEGDFSQTFTWQPDKAGTYIMRFYNNNDKLISEDFEITVQKSSGIVSTVKEGLYDVLSPSGYTVAKKISAGELQDLPEGLYILKGERGETYKLKL